MTSKGVPCKRRAIAGAKVCSAHGARAPQVKRKAAIRAEVLRWGLEDAHEDPGEVLLRLVTQSATRVKLYSSLLEEAYEAAQRLQTAYQHENLIMDVGDENSTRAADQAREDLRRIFNVGGVAALVGFKYSATKDGSLYATSEALRGLVELEGQERDRCANFATKAIAAGLAERQVRLAERQGELFASGVRAILDKLGLTEEQAAMVPQVIEATVRELSAGG